MQIACTILNILFSHFHYSPVLTIFSKLFQVLVVCVQTPTLNNTNTPIYWLAMFVAARIYLGSRRDVKYFCCGVCVCFIYSILIPFIWGFYLNVCLCVYVCVRIWKYMYSAMESNNKINKSQILFFTEWVIYVHRTLFYSATKPMCVPMLYK